MLLFMKCMGVVNLKVLCSTQMGAATIMGQSMRVISIAKALQRQGHQIKYLAGEKLMPVLKDFGIEVIPLPSMPQVDFPVNDKLMQDERYQEKISTAMKEIFKLLSSAEKEAIAYEEPDAMLCGTPTGLFSAKAVGIPCVFTILQPHGKKTFNYFRERIASGADRQKYILNLINIFAPGMPAGASLKDIAVNVMDAMGLILLEGMPEISGDADLESLGDWFQHIKDKIRFTGPLLPEAPDILPGQEELKLLYTGSQDKPLVYVTIGGGSGLIGEEFLHTVLDMFRGLPQVKGFIATGLAVPPEKMAGYNPPENVVIRGFVHGTELVKASDVTVFHGGSSTLMTCIACGRPAVVIPSMGEQEDNGAVLSQNGAGIVLDKQSLTPAILIAAVQKILTDSSFLLKAQQLKALGEKYGGAAGAALKVEELVSRRLVGAGTYSGSR
jgi:UDP:flavonoid glycosyltransferase YjiC (YdhE family)